MAEAWQQYPANSSHSDSISLNLPSLERQFELRKGTAFSQEERINVRITDVGDGAHVNSPPIVNRKLTNSAAATASQLYDRTANFWDNLQNTSVQNIRVRIM